MMDREAVEDLIEMFAAEDGIHRAAEACASDAFDRPATTAVAAASGNTQVMARLVIIAASRKIRELEEEIINLRAQLGDVEIK